MKHLIWLVISAAVAVFLWDEYQTMRMREKSRQRADMAAIKLPECPPNHVPLFSEDGSGRYLCFPIDQIPDKIREDAGL